MGKITFDPLQKIIVDEVKKDLYLSKQFYFTGGTALSIFYLHHRLSEDLDFFSEKKFPKEKVIEFISKLQAKYKFHATDMLKVDDFQILPRMLKPLTLTQLKRFFHTQAKTLAKKVTV